MRPGQLRKKLICGGNTLLFLMPWMLVFFTFSIFPILYSAYLSFTKYKASGLRPPIWVGLKNYTSLLQDTYFLRALYNSFLFVLGTVPLTIVLAVCLAIILNQKLKFRGFYRTAFFMPTISSLFVIATLFMELYAQNGYFNQGLAALGFRPLPWLKHPQTALISVMVMNVWSSFGFYAILILAGLQKIPKEYYEASGMEGAGKWHQFFTITLPLLKSTIFVATIINSIFAFQVFGEIYIMTKGGPIRSTETAVYYLYSLGFQKQNMGKASAAAYLVFLALLVFSLIQLKAFRNKNSGV